MLKHLPTIEVKVPHQELGNDLVVVEVLTNILKIKKLKQSGTCIVKLPFSGKCSGSLRLYYSTQLYIMGGGGGAANHTIEFLNIIPIPN